MIQVEALKHDLAELTCCSQAAISSTVQCSTSSFWGTSVAILPFCGSAALTRDFFLGYLCYKICIVVLNIYSNEGQQKYIGWREIPFVRKDKEMDKEYFWLGNSFYFNQVRLLDLWSVQGCPLRSELIKYLKISQDLSAITENEIFHLAPELVAFSFLLWIYNWSWRRRRSGGQNLQLRLHYLMSGLVSSI